MNREIQHPVLAVSKLIVVASLMLVSFDARSLDLETVLENVAVSPPSRVGFLEQRHNRLLKEPMVLEGYLEYVGEGQLRKVIESPFEESFFITGEFIEIERGGKTRRLALRKNKSMTAMFGGFEAILAGQVDRLTSFFRYELSGTSDAWTIRLEPVSRRVSKHLKVMLVEGDEDTANSIRLEFEDAEWSMMELLHTESEP